MKRMETKGVKNDVIHNINVLMEEALAKQIFPGAVIGISKYYDGKIEKKLIVSYGTTSNTEQKKRMEKNVFFDLASLTKPLSTTLAILCLLKEKKVYLDEKLSSLLERKITKDKRDITLKHLLNHSSGLPAYKPYFKDLINIPFQQRNKTLLTWILEENLDNSPGTHSIYSDLGFMLLGGIVEVKSKEKINLFVREKIYKPLGLHKGIFYKPLTEGGKSILAKEKIFSSTEICPWRGRELCGEVHDDNAYTLGGVSGHAGLFGNIESVLHLTTSLLEQWKDRSEHPNYLNSDLQEILKKQKVDKESTWALGFDTPAKTGSSSGKYFSAGSAGHLGYTGTSFWIDPVREMAIVLLTNRVHPRRDNEKIKEFRPVFHDTVISLLD